MTLELIVPALMGCALLWWIGRGIGMTARLLTIIVTLGLVALVLVLERVTQ